MTEDEARAFFTLAGFAVEKLYRLENGYWPDVPEYAERRRKSPWWLVKTPFGLIRIGWRKRVISIDWSDSSESNLYALYKEARGAHRVVVCWGKLHKELLHYAEQALETIQQAHRGQIFCLGVNNDGSPKHPLYIRGDAPLVPFTGVVP